MLLRKATIVVLFSFLFFSITSQTCQLTTATQTITVSASNTIIQNYHIQVKSGDGIVVKSGLSNITIQNCFIEFSTTGEGINFQGISTMTIKNVNISLSYGANSSGPLPSSDAICIDGYASSNVRITNVTVRGCSSGIYLLQCDSSYIGGLEAYNMRGPFPRGQCLQWDKCNNGTLEDFYCKNDNTSWTEDNISIYQSSNATIRRGIVDGNNSPTGAGIMFEESANGVTGGYCENVDALNQGDGCFSCYPAQNVVWNSVRARDNHCDGWSGRDPPASNALVWAGGSESGIDSHNIQVKASQYYNLCNPGNLFWPSSAFSSMDATSNNFTPRTPVHNTFCWS